MSLEIGVPDIGDFEEVEVIEVLVKPGDTVAQEQSLITLESDKASMEIPSPAAGTVRELRVRVGDKVSKGSPILVLEAAHPAPALARGAREAPIVVPAPPGAAPAGSVPRFTGSADLECDVLVLGAGPGGYSAAFRAADLGRSVVLVERHATLGGVCLNVGCIPSKALLHVAAVIDEASHFADLGVTFGRPAFDLERLRAHRARVVAKLTGGLSSMAKARKVRVMQGVGTFADGRHLAVATAEGTRNIRFEQAIIAAGSQSVKLPFLPQDPRIVDSTGALELPFIPGRMLVIGGGIIGLEMATVYAALGSRIDVVEMTDGLMPGTDRDLVRTWQKFNASKFEPVMLRTRTTGAEARADGVWVAFEGEGAPAEPQRYDLVLQSVGRSPNGRRIGADRAGVLVDERGFIAVDSQMRTNVPHIFAIGDVVGQPMLAHKATHEGHVAAEAAAGMKSHFDATVIASVAYTDPEIAWVGVTEDAARAAGRKLRKGLFPWSASGRAIANARDEGFTKLLFDEQTHRIVGGGIVGTHAGDLIGEIALAIEMGADAVDIGKTIHPHPTLGESLGLAAEAAEGICTDLAPPRR
jgi:dihydrolipoamide dehydrogenase